MLSSLRELAQRETEANVRALIAIRDSKRAPAAARIAAIRELFDRGYGKSAKPLDGDRVLPTVNFIIERTQILDKHRKDMQGISKDAASN